MRTLKFASLLAVALAVAVGVSACEREKGPAEKLGAKLDAAASDAKAAAEKAKEDIQNAAEKAKKDLE